MKIFMKKSSSSIYAKLVSIKVDIFMEKSYAQGHLPTILKYKNMIIIELYHLKVMSNTIFKHLFLVKLFHVSGYIYFL